MNNDKEDVYHITIEVRVGNPRPLALMTRFAEMEKWSKGSLVEGVHFFGQYHFTVKTIDFEPSIERFRAYIMPYHRSNHVTYVEWC